MGASALRRYHTPVKAAKVPDLEPGSIARTEVTAEEVIKANDAKVGREQKVQRDRAKAEKAESVHPVIRGDSQLSEAAQADPSVGEGVDKTPEPAKATSK